MRFQEQLARHSLALISLLIALTALGYNTWRNEQTEYNRNLRQAGFEMLVHIAELQRISYLAHFDQDLDAGNPRKGWAEVFVLRDLAMLLPASTQQRAQALFNAWREHSPRLADDEQALALIDRAVNKLRNDVVAVIGALD